MEAITDKKADQMIDLYQENEKLKKEVALLNGILEVLASGGFEGEIIYTRYKIQEGIQKVTGKKFL